MINSSSLMCLEGCRERGLPLLAAHQVGPQQVDDDDVTVERLQLLEVRVESRSGEFWAPGDSDLVGAKRTSVKKESHTTASHHPLSWFTVFSTLLETLILPFAVPYTS